MNPYGPLSDQIVLAMSEFPFFVEYRKGALPRETYLQRLQENSDAIIARMGNPRFLNLLASRYPASFDDNADTIFDQLLSDGFVDNKPSVAEFEEFRRRVLASYDHGENRTFIHPDEARLAWFVSMTRKPKRMVMIGSYYAYWAVWALPGVKAAGGKATLIDPNPAVCELAEKNLARLGLSDCVEIIAKGAEEVIPSITESVDLVLLDASGGKANTDPEWHGKGIYAIMTEMIFDRMREGGLLLTHNDYLPEVGPNPLSTEFITMLSEKLTRFHTFCASHFRKSRVNATPDGFGVYMK